MIDLIFTLLVAFQIKHFVCDYLLQNEYMLGKFNKEGWVKPLQSHCMVHVMGTVVILFTVATMGAAITWGMLITCAIFDFITHFIIDRIKASPDMLGKYNKEQKEFWWSLGFDQMAHHLVHYLIILFVVSNI